MKYERFEELPVWKAAIDLAIETYALTGLNHKQSGGAGVGLRS